jgi:hypothetical protein
MENLDTLFYLQNSKLEVEPQNAKYKVKSLHWLNLHCFTHKKSILPHLISTEIFLLFLLKDQWFSTFEKFKSPIKGYKKFGDHHGNLLRCLSTPKKFFAI